MDTIITVILFGVFGLIMGSFAGAQVWRLRARQLYEDKEAHESYNKVEFKRLKPLLGKKGKRDRSCCLQCHHALAWYDLIPIVSWLSTSRKCRYCRKPIGWFEPVVELMTAALFVVSYVWWPFPLTGAGWILTVGWISFALWLVSLVLLVMLAAYDLKWQLLPNRLTWAYAALALIFVVLRFVFVYDIDIWSLAGAVAIMSGLYFVLSVLSHGTWIGEGDVKLGLGLGLMLASWEKAFLALFLANFIGCIIVLPGLIGKKLKPGSEIPFGPLFILGMLISYFAANPIVTWLFAVTTF